MQIANRLYVNGIDHQYGPVYEHDLLKNGRNASQLDLRLAASGVYIEHFGVSKVQGSDGAAHHGAQR